MSCTAQNPNNYGESDWFHGFLPIRYNITSNLWPVNNVDPLNSITGIAASGNYAEVTVSGAVSPGLTDLQYVQITNATTEAYNGVWQVDTQSSSNTVILRMPFAGDATGTLQKYYNNYAVSVRVYTGISPTHYLAAERPMALRGTLNAIPGLDNIAEVDVSSYVRKDLVPLQDRLCDTLESGEFVANDWYSWTSFYIEIAETYDESNGSNVFTFTSPYEPDSSGGVINYKYASSSTNQMQNEFGTSAGQYTVGTYSPLLPGLFMTNFRVPTYFDPYEFDLAIINTYENYEAYVSIYAQVIESDSSGNQIATTDLVFPTHDQGVYRIALSEHVFQSACTDFTVQVRFENDVEDYALSELKQCKRDSTYCGNGETYLRWLSPLGGWDSWMFPNNKDELLRMGDSTQIRRDLTSNWDSSFVNAETEDDYIYTEAYNAFTVRSKFTNTQETQVLNKWLRISNKVIQNYLDTERGCGGYLNRTVLVDRGDILINRQGPGLNEVQITYRATDRTRIQTQ